MPYCTLSLGLKYWNRGLCHRPFELSGMTGLPFQTKLFWIQTGVGPTESGQRNANPKKSHSNGQQGLPFSPFSVPETSRDGFAWPEIPLPVKKFWSQCPETPTCVQCPIFLPVKDGMFGKPGTISAQLLVQWTTFFWGRDNSELIIFARTAGEVEKA